MIITSKVIKEELINNLKIKYESVKKTLVIINQNKDLATEKFINSKKRLADTLNVKVDIRKLDLNVSKEEIIEILRNIEQDKQVNGVIVQLPINNHKEILKNIPVKKDIDCLSPYNLGLFMRGQSTFIPPVVYGVDKMLKELNKNVKGKKVLIIGAGILTGEPLTSYFMQKQAEVMVVNEFVSDLAAITKQADIIISATGVCHLIGNNHITSGQLLIDLGGGSLDGKLVGDINTQQVSETADVIPVPGGIGPLTVIGIFENLILTQ